jgi:hypothetical protein
MEQAAAAGIYTSFTKKSPTLTFSLPGESKVGDELGES